MLNGNVFVFVDILVTSDDTVRASFVSCTFFFFLHNFNVSEKLSGMVVASGNSNAKLVVNDHYFFINANSGAMTVGNA